MFLRLKNGTELVNARRIDRAVMTSLTAPAHLHLIINGAAYDYFQDEAVDLFGQLQLLVVTAEELLPNPPRVDAEFLAEPSAADQPSSSTASADSPHAPPSNSERE